MSTRPNSFCVKSAHALLSDDPETAVPRIVDLVKTRIPQ